MREFWKIVRCFLGLHRYECIKGMFLGEKIYRGQYHMPVSSICWRCERCQKVKFTIEPGNWKEPEAKDSELEQLKKMSGL